MSHKIFTKRLYKFLAVLLICFGLIFLNPKGIFNPIRFFALKISYPFQKTFYLAGKSIADSWKFISSIAELKKENEELIKENFFLKSELAILQDQKKENEVLRCELELIPKNKFDLEASFVIGHDPQGLGSWIMIDKGEKNGIKVGMPVIFSEGILIGKIEEVYFDSAKIILLSNAESVINVTDLETGAKGILKGEYGLGIVFDMISQKDVVNVGDTVITSGLGSNMPKGFLVGKVQEVRLSNDKLFQQAVINPTVKSQSLEVVFVVKN